jgi:RHS repeat-associated protein
MTASSSLTSGSPLNPVTTSSTTDSTWDLVFGGSVPLNINDATTTSAAPTSTTNTSYLYGDLLFGGTAPLEQISGSTASFLLTNQTGVQEVVGSSGTVQEKAIYSVYGTQLVQSGSKVTPFGYQGSYTDSTGLIYLVNRYYDPTTDQFLSIDPDVATTDQPYVFTNDDPLNAEDPLGELPAPVIVNESKKEVVKKSSTYIDDEINAIGMTGVLADVAKEQVKRELEDSGGVLSNSEVDALSREAVDATMISKSATVIEVAATVIDDVNSGHGYAYAVGDAATSYGGGQFGFDAGVLICGGPEDGFSLACGAAGALGGGYIAHWVYHHYVQ